MTENYEIIRHMADELEAIVCDYKYDEDGELITIGDWLAKRVLEVCDYYVKPTTRKTRGPQIEYEGVRLLITYGGPNIYIDTCRGEIEIYWGEREYISLESSVVDAIDCYFMDDLNDLIYHY